MASSIQNPMEKAHICRPVWSTKMVCLSALCVLHFFIYNSLFGPILQGVSGLPRGHH